MLLLRFALTRRRKPSGHPSRRYPTPLLYVQLRCTHGSSGHSGSSSGLLVLANTAPPQRRRGCVVVSPGLRLRLHSRTLRVVTPIALQAHAHWRWASPVRRGCVPVGTFVFFRGLSHWVGPSRLSVLPQF